MLKHLSLGEMYAVTRPWVTRKSRKEAFLSIPEIAGLYPKVVKIHHELVDAQPSEAVSPALKKLIEQGLVADARHDALARAVHAGVVADRAAALAEKPPAIERARMADQVQAKLFPNGLAIVNVSHLAESANTARVARLIEQEPAVSAFLEAIPVQNVGSLKVVAQRWIAAGKQLANIEHEREELEVEEATTPLGREASNRLRARWIRLVAQVLSLLEMSDADRKAIETIRMPVLKMSARAGNRYGEPEDAALVAEGDVELEDEGEDDEDDVLADVPHADA